MRIDECKECKKKISCNIFDRARRTACKDYEKNKEDNRHSKKA